MDGVKIKFANGNLLILSEKGMVSWYPGVLKISSNDNKGVK